MNSSGEMPDRAAIKARLEATLAAVKQKAVTDEKLHFNQEVMVRVTLPPHKMPDGTEEAEVDVEMPAIVFGKNGDEIFVTHCRPSQKERDYEQKMAFYLRLPNCHGGPGVSRSYPISAIVSENLKPHEG